MNHRLNGLWKLNLKLSESINPILKLEGRNWAQRKAASLMTISQEITINEFSKTVVTRVGPIKNISNSDNSNTVFVETLELLEIITNNPDGTVWKTCHSLIDKDTKLTKLHYTKDGKTITIKQVFNRIS